MHTRLARVSTISLWSLATLKVEKKKKVRMKIFGPCFTVFVIRMRSHMTRTSRCLLEGET